VIGRHPARQIPGAVAGRGHGGGRSSKPSSSLPQGASGRALSERRAAGHRPAGVHARRGLVPRERSPAGLPRRSGSRHSGVAAESGRGRAVAQARLHARRRPNRACVWPRSATPPRTFRYHPGAGRLLKRLSAGRTAIRVRRGSGCSGRRPRRRLAVEATLRAEGSQAPLHRSPPRQAFAITRPNSAGPDPFSCLPRRPHRPPAGVTETRGGAEQGPWPAQGRGGRQARLARSPAVAPAGRNPAPCHRSAPNPEPAPPAPVCRPAPSWHHASLQGRPSAIPARRPSGRRF